MSFADFLLIAPPHTPFDAQGRVQLAVVEDQARWLAKSGVDGVFVAGSTGECASLTVAEREELTERWLSVAPQHDLEVIVQVGENAQPDAIRLAAHAQRSGADAVAAHAPSYFRPASVDALIEFLAPIAAAAGDLPFYFYDIPCTTGVRLPMVEFLSKAKAHLPNLVGLKYSNDDLIQLQECLQFQEGQYRVMFGSDEVLLAAAALGVHGAIGSTYNFVAPLYRQMLAAFEEGDLVTARRLQAQSVAIVRALSRYGFLPASKVVMRWLGMDCGSCRAPFRSLSLSDESALRADCERLGILASLSTSAAAVMPAGPGPA